MSVRAIRWLLFAALVIALPFPMLGPFEAFVPPVRYAVLLGAASTVALAEGAAGPVPWILLLLALNLTASLAVAWVLAWISSRLLARLHPPTLRAVLVVAALGIGLALTASLPIYETGFGRAPTANLLGLLR